MNRHICPLAVILLSGIANVACADTSLTTEGQKVGYSYGVDIANNLKRQGAEIDIKALIRGIEEASAGKKLALTDEEMGTAKVAFQKKLRESMQAKSKEVAEKNKIEGEKFLAANAKKDGVVTTESGLQYKIIKSGTGASPTADDTVVTNYKGTLIDGREFDSSYKRGQPATFPVKGVIKGWTEALQLMKVGDKWELFIPADIAYGQAKRGALIEANSTLIFELELLEINPPKPEKK